MTDLAPPPAKRRRILSAVKVPMTRYSDYLAAFGATPSPGSISQMYRKMSTEHDLTQQVEPVATFAEPHNYTQRSPSEASVEKMSASQQDADVVNLLDDDDDVIVGRGPLELLCHFASDSQLTPP